MSTDLTNFLEVVEKVTQSVADDAPLTADGLAAVGHAGILDLALDAGDLDDADAWIAHTVRVAAHDCPSLAFLLAARYAAQRALTGRGDDQPHPTFAVGAAEVVAPTALAPSGIVVVDLVTESARLTEWSEVDICEQRRTGLKGAALVTVTLSPATPGTPLTTGPKALRDWDLLTSAALLGIAEAAHRTAIQYANARHQFGVAISSFAGLRALLGEMELRTRGLASMLDAALSGDQASAAVAATAGRVAVSVAIDAIQVHGGYGYIEEYPVAGLLRDAVSLQARSGGRRAHLARVATRAIGISGGPS